MSFLVGEMGIILLGATLIGALVAWLISRSKCQQATDALNEKITNLQNELASQTRELQTKEKLLSIEKLSCRMLQGNLAKANGEINLMQSRWQNTLKVARQLPNHKRWVSSLQNKLAHTKTSLAQNREYAEAMAAKAHATQDNLQRTHNRLTEVDAQVSNLKDWIHVFQQKLVKTKTEYGQLRNFATAADQGHRATRENLQRVHTRLSEIDGKQQPLRTWIRVFQTKLKKTKTEYGQIRSYATNVQTKLDATSENLQRVHHRLTKVTNELQHLKAGNDPSMPPIPPLAQVSDNKALRLVDRIRLLGTKPDEVYGRMNNQLREARLDSVRKERVLTDSCEEKDAIINDLRQQLRKSENRAQKAPVEVIDQTVRIKELEAELARSVSSVEDNKKLESIIKEHEITIAAFKTKAANDTQETTQAAPVYLDESDDLKLIKGIGPKLEGILNEIGVTRFAQIAEWTNKDIENISSKLGSFKDRITRDNWIKKARKLHKEKYS